MLVTYVMYACLPGNMDDVNSPKVVEALKDVKIVDVGCGRDDGHSLAVDSEGASLEVACMRVVTCRPLCVLAMCVARSACVWSCGQRCSHAHVSTCVCVCSEAALPCSAFRCCPGCLWSWGDNSCSKLGLGPNSDKSKTTPTRLDQLNGVKFMKVRCGSHISVALTTEGQVFTWWASLQPSHTVLTSVRVS